MVRAINGKSIVGIKTELKAVEIFKLVDKLNLNFIYNQLNTRVRPYDLIARNHKTATNRGKP